MENTKSITGNAGNDTWIDEVIAYWKDCGVELGQGVSAERIRQTENLLGFQLPGSFRQLYYKVNGFKDWGMNENMFSLWPLEKIEEEYRYYRFENFFGFCDYLVNSHWIGFVRDKNGIYKQYDLANDIPVKIADTFRDAVFMINLNSGDIY
jgi:hypothetical protein